MTFVQEKKEFSLWYKIHHFNKSLNEEEFMIMIKKILNDLDQIITQEYDISYVGSMKDHIGRGLNLLFSSQKFQEGYDMSNKILMLEYDWNQGIYKNMMDFYYIFGDIDKMLDVLILIDSKSNINKKYKIHQREIDKILYLCSISKNKVVGKRVLDISSKHKVKLLERNYIDILILYNDDFEKILIYIGEMVKFYPIISHNYKFIICGILSEHGKTCAESSVEDYQCDFCDSKLSEFPEFCSNRNEILKFLDSILDKLLVVQKTSSRQYVEMLIEKYHR